jgi:sarcosine oxidase, subunit beta
MSASVPETAAIVIVGGGAAGCGIAFFLARRGLGREVVLLERDLLASGSTGRAAGGIRAQFSTEINVRFSLEAQAFFRRFEEETAFPADYREIGYLFLASTEGEKATFERNVRLQRSLGVPVQLLTPQQAGDLVPALQVGDLTAATYSPTDAVATPEAVTQAFAAGARRGGVQVREGEQVVAIDVSGGRVRGVQTAMGRIETPALVIAAGVWSPHLGRLAGVDIPVKPYRRELFVSEPFEAISECPLTIDLHTGWYFRREGPGILMAGNKDAHSSYDTHVDWSQFDRVAAVATHRVPALAEAEFAGGKAWAGLYDVSPDDHAILGAVPNVEGLYVATGFSGHGFMHSPTTGRLMSELLLDGRTTGIDIAPLSLARFATGATLHESLTAHSGSIAA